jgi:hypothetical protein
MPSSPVHTCNAVVNATTAKTSSAPKTDSASRTAFVASRRALRARVTEVVERFLADHPVRTGWDAASLTVVLVALTHGLAVEALPDPSAVPSDLLGRVLTDLVGPQAP